MARFRFRLQKVLDHRRRLVDLRATDLAAAASRVAAIDRRIAEARAEQDRWSAETDGGTLDVARMGARTAWVARLDRAIAGLRSERASADAAVEAARAALQEAWRDREVIEKLRERQHQEWELEERRRETAQLDEIGGQRRAAAQAALSR